MGAETDPRLDPDKAHPLFVSDCERSNARLADIELGLAGDPGDRWFWRDKANRRIEALEDDAVSFGLMPHEEAELERLKAMVAKADERLQP
jgi:hypothetical protein